MACSASGRPAGNKTYTSVVFVDNKKNLAIAHRSRVSCAHNTSKTPNLMVSQETIGYITQDLLVVELFEVEYYRVLEIRITDHSSSFKLVPFESLGAVSYSPSMVTMATSCIVCKI